MNNEKGKNIKKKSSKDDLSLQSQEERIKKNTPKNNKRKKIAVATTATVLIATAIAVPTVIYLSRRKFDVNVLTNTDIVEEYTINVKRGVYIRNLTAKQIEGYTFVGFYKDANLTQPYGENDKVSKNMQIYAKYEINIYSLKFPTSPAFTIEGEAIEGNQVNIEYNTEYQFKINLNAGYTESEITVKANGEIIEADSNGYYTLTVKDDIVIEVEGVAINTYTITFYDETGETIYKIEEVEYNQDSTYKEIPTKHSTPTYNYTFAGWVDREGKPVDLTNIIVDKDVYASFTEEYIEYRINKIPSQVVIKNSEGIELTGSNTLHYGDIVEITYNVTEGHNVVDFSVVGAERIEDTNTYKITGDLTVTYSEEIQTFDVTISVNNPEYGTVNITNISVDYGTEIIETFDELKIGEFTIKATPTDDNPTYNYSFVNWTNAVSEVKEDLTITANFVRTMDEYIVSIIVNNADYGSVSQPSLVVNYNTPIVIEGNKLIIDGQEIYAEPKDNTAQYSYEFIDWSNATDVITGNREIIANFNRTTNSYTVTFYDENKTTILDTLTDEYGTSIVYSGEEPTKSVDNTYTYTFECWETAEGEEYDLSGKTITSDLVLYARYRATYIEYDISEIPAQVEIRKGGEELTSSDTIHYGDRIEITYTVTTGYNMTEFSVTGATREDETNFYTVTGDLTVIYEEDYIDYTIADIPTQITIKRNNIILTTEDVIHYGDVIEITYNVTEGYEFENLTVTGADQIDNTNQYTVTGNLTINYSEQIKTFEITIAVNNSEYGKLNIYSVTVPYGTTYVAEGNTLTFSDNTKVIAEKFEDTAQYTYTFTGWSSDSGTVTAEATIIANFNRVTNSYTVTFYDENKITVLDTLTDEYGTSIVYSGEEPTKSVDNTYTYTFECWETAEGEEYDLSGKTITSDLVLYARYRATYIEYDISEIPAQVEIRKGGEELTSSDTIHYGDRIEITYTVTTGYNMTEFSVTGATREGETNFYTVTGDLTVIYSEEIQTFAVTIEVNNAEYGSLNIYSVTVPYGTTYVAEGNTLTFSDNTKVIAEKFEDTAQYTYTFTGWSSDSGTVTAEEIITANFNRVTNIYTVTFYDENKTTVLDTLKDEYGTSIVYSGANPTKPADNTYAYTFECWETADGEEYDLSGKTITSDLALYARYSATYIEYDIAEIPAQVEIRKGEEELTSSDTLHYGDVVEITYTVTPHYNMTEFSVTGATREGETNFYTVTGDLTVIYSEEIQTFAVTIEVNNAEYGSLNIYSVTVPYGTTYVAEGNTLTFSDNTKVIAEKFEDTAQYTYTFTGWSSDSGTVTAEEIITANFNRVTNIYTVTFYDENKTTVLDTLKDEYGTSIVYSGANPTKPADNTYAYTFECWETAEGEEYDLSGKTITSDLALYAKYRATYIEYDISEIPLQVEIRKDDLELSSNDKLHYGDRIEITYTVTPHYNMTEFSVTGATREGETNIYTVTGDLTVIYSEEIQTFTVQWLNYDGTLLETDTVAYGSIPEYNGEIPVRESTDDEYVYTFTGWDPETSEVKENISYTAQFRQDEILYFTITSGMITGYTGTDTEVIIPNSYSIAPDGRLITGDAYDVTSIGSYAFDGCTGLTSITIPTSVTSIGSYAFYRCTGLTSITLPDSVTNIVSWAFNGCDNLANVYYEGTIEEWIDISYGGIDANPLTNGANLYVNGDELVTEINIDSATTINSYAFQGCKSLTKVTIGSQVTSTGSYAFYNCTGLTSITIPDSVTSIGSSTFSGCTGLTSITIPGSVTSIGDNAFSRCTGLTSITIPDSVTSIGSYAFIDCTGLTSITIPDSVTSIGILAFSGCNLTSVTIESNYAYKNAGTGYNQCGYLLRYATVVRVLTSCIGEDTNSYLENSANFTKSIDGEYTVYTKV